jgi:hypothetical protein
VSSFFDRWVALAQHCAGQRVDPAPACEMHAVRLAQAEAYYTWVSRRRDARKAVPSPDPMAEAYRAVPLLRTDRLYADALEEIVGPLPREGGLYSWARAALERLREMPAEVLYGGAGWSDWSPWGLFTQMVAGNLHQFAHYVGNSTPYSDNPYRGGRRIPDWPKPDADEWVKANLPGFRY